MPKSTSSMKNNKPTNNLIENPRNSDSELDKYDFPSLVTNTSEYAQSLSIDDLAFLLKKASYYYYNSGISIVTDSEFDILEEVLKKRDPKNKVFKEIGAPVISNEDKVKLPYWMGSMDKIKPGKNEIGKWSKNYSGPYLVSHKLDGISCLFDWNSKNNLHPKLRLFTRGDGKYGKDITHVAKYIKLPNLDSGDGAHELVVRGELIISKAVFEKNHSQNYANGRNMVSGLLNSKTLDARFKKEIKDVEFIAYELIIPSDLKPSDQFKLLKSRKFKVAEHQILETVSEIGMIELLKSEKEGSDYEIDGLIIAQNKVHPRYTNGNPKYAKAFKMNMEDQSAQVTVEDVVWNASRYGKLFPKVIYTPVKLGGAVLHQATGYHAQYIKENKIGKGAEILIVRSGDVIPDIIKVIKPAPKGAQMPDVPYKWDDNGVHIFNDSDEPVEEVEIKQIASFFKIIGVADISQGIITKLYQNGLTTIRDILDATPERFRQIDGIQDRMAKKIYGNIHKVIQDPIDLAILMSASGAFGMGYDIKRFKLLLKHYPDLMERKKLSLGDIISIHGFQEKTAQPLVKGLPNFKQFLQKHPELKYFVSNSQGVSSNGKLAGMKIVETGVRLKPEQVKMVEAEGGEVVSGVNSKTTHLIAKDPNGSSSKIQNAKKMGIEIISLDDFVAKYLS